jgi:hypothetical protein
MGLEKELIMDLVVRGVAVGYARKEEIIMFMWGQWGPRLIRDKRVVYYTTKV